MKTDTFFYHNDQELVQKQCTEYFSEPSKLVLFRAVTKKEILIFLT